MHSQCPAPIPALLRGNCSEKKPENLFFSRLEVREWEERGRGGEGNFRLCETEPPISFSSCILLPSLLVFIYVGCDGCGGREGEKITSLEGRRRKEEEAFSFFLSSLSPRPGLLGTRLLFPFFLFSHLGLKWGSGAEGKQAGIRQGGAHYDTLCVFLPYPSRASGGIHLRRHSLYRAYVCM